MSGTVSDGAGHTATTKFTPVKIDKSAPMVTYSPARPAYTIDQQVAITCSVADPKLATGETGSGIASTTCAAVSGAAYTFSKGVNTRTATAWDRAGNAGSGSVTFTVGVTYASLHALDTRFATNQGVATTLNKLLTSAQTAEQRGMMTAKAAAINSYRVLVVGQTGKGLTRDRAAILLKWVAYL